jgi:hypothetical protein
VSAVLVQHAPVFPAFGFRVLCQATASFQAACMQAPNPNGTYFSC